MRSLGLYALVAIGVVVWARWRLRRFSKVAAALLLALPLPICGEALLFDRVFAPIDLAYASPPLAALREGTFGAAGSPPVLSDVYCQMVPWRTTVARALGAGEWPLWNPHIQNGTPLLASGQPAALSPLTLVSLLLPPDLSLGVSAALTLLLAGLGAFLFFRDVGLREPGSLFGALVWAYSGFLLFWLHWPHAKVAAFYPWILLATQRIVRRRGSEPVVGLGALVALALLAGHPETVLHVVALAALFGLPLLFARRSRPAAALRRIAFAGALGALLAAVFLLPFLEALPQTLEYHLRRHVLPPADDLPAAEAALRLLPQVVPFAFGWFGWHEGTAPGPWSFPGTAYVGSAAVAAALAGLAARGRFAHRGFVLATLVGGLMAGVAMPPAASLLGRLPLFSLAINDRLIFAAAFALAWLGGRGLDQVRRRGRRLVTVGLVGTLALLGAAALVALAVGPRWGVPPALQLPRLALHLGVALAGAAGLALSTRRARLGLVALLALLAAQRALEMRPYHQSFERTAFYPRVPPLDRLSRSEEPIRVVALGYAWIPNVSAMYDLEDARGYEAMTNDRLHQTQLLWSVPQGTWFNRVDALDSPVLDFLNVGYALVPPGFRLPHRWRRIASANGVDLVENRRVAPRAFLPRRIRLGRVDALVPELLAERNYVRTVRVEPWDGSAPAEPVTLDNGPGSVVVRRRGTAYEVDVELEREAWIATSITAWKGWRARAGERELPLGFANHAFLAVRAPAGRYRLDLVYRPRSFDRGLAATALGVVLSAALLAGARWRRGGGPAAPDRSRGRRRSG